MTTNTCARRGIYIENPLPDKPRAKESKDCNPLIPAIQSTGSNMPLWKALAFAGGLVLGLYSAPLHVASSCAASSQGSGTHHCSPARTRTGGESEASRSKPAKPVGPKEAAPPRGYPA